MLTFSFEFLQLVSTLVLSRFPGLVRPVPLALLLVRRGGRGSFVEHRKRLLFSSCSLLVRLIKGGRFPVVRFSYSFLLVSPY